MLIEISSPVFKEKGKIRAPIHFHSGLNVVLGEVDGANSIGKSSALLAIDFVFGGNTYLESDGVKFLGDHTIFFAYEFDGQRWDFARSTSEPDVIVHCDENKNYKDITWEKAEFIAWLHTNYQTDFSGLSFRDMLSSFFRIYGKDNLDETRPLYGVRGDNMEKSIKRIICMFNRYQEIDSLNERRLEQKDRLSIFKKARSYQFIPAMVDGKKQYEENLANINELRVQLDDLEHTQTEVSSHEDIEKGQIKRSAKRTQMELESQLSVHERKLKLLHMSLEYGLYPTEADLSSLQEFFPDANIRKIYEVEGYHKKLAKILDEQFHKETLEVEGEIQELRDQLTDIKARILELGFVGNVSQEFLDNYSEVKGKIDALQNQNDAYLKLLELQDAQKKANEMLKRATGSILSEIEDLINGKMKKFNDFLFKEKRMAPYLKFNEYNSYHFETPHDTGTGTNYKGLILYDLAMLELTNLPAIAHDSSLLKNVGDSSVDGIIKIYSNYKKQIFIAFDKHLSYTDDVAKIIEENTVLTLYANGGELYGYSWNKEQKLDDENEL